MKFKLGLGVVALACVFAPMAMADGGGGNMSSAPSTEPASRNNGRASTTDPQACYSAGVAAMRAHDYPTAIRSFECAHHALPQNGTINYAMGVAYNASQQPTEARDAFRRAIRDSNNAPPDAWVQLANVSLALGDRETAEAQLPALERLISRCGSQCGVDRTAALQAAHDGVAHLLAPPAPVATPAAPAPDSTTPASPAGQVGMNFPSMDDARLAYGEGVGFVNQQRYADAHDAFMRAEYAVGPNPDVLNYMGFVSRKLGRFDDAFAYYGQALAIDPNHLGANEYLGELYVQLGMYDRARVQLARLDQLCAYGCVQREELAHWIDASATR